MLYTSGAILLCLLVLFILPSHVGCLWHEPPKEGVGPRHVHFLPLLFSCFSLSGERDALRVRLLLSVPAAGPRTPVVPLAPSVEQPAGCARPMVLVGGGGGGGGSVVFSPGVFRFSHFPSLAMCPLLKQEQQTIFELKVEATWPVCKHFPHFASFDFISLW